MADGSQAERKRTRQVAIATIVLSLGLAMPVVAQHRTPEAIRRQLLEIGFGDSFVRTSQIYEPLLTAAPKTGVSVTKDFAYGDHARHRLDVYRPEGARAAPVLVYVHGGGYRSGDRDISDNIYGNVGYYFARQGLVVVNATYRLAPEATWPSGAEDLRDVMQWIQRNIAAHGGDPERVFMMGHSAGATHVATYAWDTRFHLPSGNHLAGIVLVSGRYTIKDAPDDPSFDGIRRYFGDDPSAYATRSAITHIAGSRVPVFLVIAEFDQQNLVETTGELFTALCVRDGGRCPRLVQLPYHNHMSEIFHINTAEDVLGREVLEFIRDGAARRQAWR